MTTPFGTTVHLRPQDFGETSRELVQAGPFTVTTFRYSTGVAGLKVVSDRVELEVLPYLGQMIWEAHVDGIDLGMDDMFDAPRPAEVIVDTYGCFSFHSGLLAGGCPASEDDHPLHGEMACAPMDSCWVTIHEDTLIIGGHYEYVQGFGHHYRARPGIVLTAGSPVFDITMEVTNLSAGQAMPLQYMCHMNHAYLPDAAFAQSIPDEAWHLRESVPAHVHPTPAWESFTADILAGRLRLDTLDKPDLCDPEIVYFADDLARFGPEACFELRSPDGHTFVTSFATADFPVATRWILHNADQRVAAFVLPGTSRPEGREAARRAGTLIELGAGKTRSFTVTTGLSCPQASAQNPHN
ncbi:aldose 1-epimerase family protein [Austwickia chelonae]|uniref:aldose 1-epimerase family protein n=1 Tax=Austwickia chelonae TaxID=100225 RepID=UPI000E284714|nr:aldose 1-epimerase family protein [Austwickia chelonae]